MKWNHDRKKEVEALKGGKPQSKSNAMLKRLKAQVTQVANELPGVLGQNNVSSERERMDDISSLENEDGEIEGFLCPMCMGTLGSPEELQKHFEQQHSEQLEVSSPSAGVENPNFNATGVNGISSHPNVSFSSKDKEIDELRIQVKEERQFSQNIKNELDRLQSVVAVATDVPDGEVPYLMQQIQVLEAGKSMVTQRMLELDKENGQLKRSLENTDTARTEVMTRLKQLTLQVRELTEENETNRVDKEVLERKFTKTKSEVSRLTLEVEQLTKSLDQRPSEDDVTVLRTELINAQKLMDDIAQQKDVEIQEHMHSIRQLNMEREKEHCIRENMERQLLDTGNVSRDSSDRLTQLTSDLAETRAQLENSRKEASDFKREAITINDSYKEMQNKLNANIAELGSCRDRISQLEETVRISEREIESSHSLNEKNQERLTALSSKLEQMLDEKSRREAELNDFEERQGKQSDDITCLEQSNTELTNELASLGSVLEKERSLVAEKNSALQEKTKECGIAEDRLDNMEKKVQRLQSDVDEKVLLVESLTSQVSAMQEKNSDLMNKITEGEGGTRLAMDQLNEEKNRLIGEIRSLTENLKQLKDEGAQQVEVLEKKLRESERRETEVKQCWQQEREQTDRQTREAEDELSRKNERLVDVERELENERRKTSERITKMKELMQQNDKKAMELKAEVEQLSLDVASRDKQIREKDSHIEENRQRLEDTLKRVEEAEVKARKLEALLNDSEGRATQASSAETELRQRLADMEQELLDVKQQATMLDERVKERDAELARVDQEHHNKEEHWKSKREEYEKQLERNQEANEELLNTVKQLQETVQSVEKERDNKETRLGNVEAALEEVQAKAAELETEAIEKRSALEMHLQLLDTANEESRSQLEELNAVKQKNEEVQQQLKSAEDALATVHMESEKLRGIHEQRETELESRIADGERTRERLTAEIEAKARELNELGDAKSRLEFEVSSKTDELQNISARVLDYETSLEDEKRRVEETERMRDEMKMQSEWQTQTSRQMEEELIDRQRVLEKELASSQKELAEKIDVVTKLENKCAQFERMVKDLHSDHERDAAQKQAEIDAALERLCEVEDKCMMKENELAARQESDRRALQTLEEEMNEQKRISEDSQKTAEEMTAKVMELTQKSSSWDDEKNALIQRCLATESDLEFERERAMENKRRFDESLSAMHELGRANQSLQMDMNKFTNRKWLDDSAAMNCTDCGKAFSMTVRKHHCRVCGLIYCNTCSGRTVRVTSAKNPVRACRSCHTELSNR